MWIFTETGFVSAVVHRDEPDTIIARARDARSLDELGSRSGSEVTYTPDADYHHRVSVSRADFQAWLSDSVSTMDYPNFKDRVHETREPAFLDALYEVWGAMHRYQSELD
jgi:hypothetical protein